MRRTVKELLVEAKDASELMVDLAYAAVFFGDEDLAREVTRLEDRDVPDVTQDVVVDADLVQRGVAGVRDDVGVGHRGADRHDLFVHRLHDVDGRADAGVVPAGGERPPAGNGPASGKSRCSAPKANCVLANSTFQPASIPIRRFRSLIGT